MKAAISVAMLISLMAGVTACDEAQGNTYNPNVIKKWEMEVPGPNHFVIEFTPLSDDRKTCVYVARDTAAGLYCWVK